MFLSRKGKALSRTLELDHVDSVLESYVRQYIEAQHVPVVQFAWRGGEPTLLGVDFFRKAIALQKRFAAGKQIINVFQTNGVLLDDQ